MELCISVRILTECALAQKVVKLKIAYPHPNVIKLYLMIAKLKCIQMHLLGVDVPAI